MRKLMKKKVNVFGKGIPVFVIVLLGLTLTSAALLAVYGTITGLATVTQSVTLNGLPYDATMLSWSKSFVAGETSTDCGTGIGYSVKNNAGVIAPIQFGTTCRNILHTDDGTITASSIDWATVGDSYKACDGIVTEIYGVLKLTTKTVDFTHSPWTATNTAKATVKYTIVGDTFSATVINSTITDLSGYTLIYYKDNSDRFNHPAQAIKLTEIAESLPYATDGNVDEYNYCGLVYNEVKGWTGDNYAHCHGAKIWLVPTTAIASGNILDWGRASEFLFETDLITYTKTADGKITLPANGGGFNFCVKNDFALNLVPDKYTITTQILPA